MTQSMNLALGANFELLKTNLTGVFEKDDKGSRVLLAPTKVDNPTSVTLEEMIVDFKKAFNMSEEDSKKIEDSLNNVKKEGSSFDISKIAFQLQAAFLYRDAPTNGTATTEYAFAVSVDMSDALPDFGFVKLNSLFVAVWNTDRQAVLRQIGTGNINKMLTNLEA